MSTPTITDAERSKNWRKANPEKAAQLQNNTTKNRRARKEKDPEFAEDVRRRAREAMDERRKRALEGAPDGWKVVVRLAGEKRARGLVEIKYTDSGTIRGLLRQRPGSMTPQSFETREEAEEIVQRLLSSFPDKIEVAKVSVI